MTVWWQLDVYGQIIGRFDGDTQALRAHMSRDIKHEPGLVFSTSHQVLWLWLLPALVDCTVETLATPWGRLRYVRPTHRSVARQIMARAA